MNSPASHSLPPTPPSKRDVRSTVTVVICTRNHPIELQTCLESVAQLRPAADEVLVVDNTAGDRQTERVTAAFGARYTFEPIAGLSRARNRALLEYSSDIVAFLDDDALPCKDWLSLILEPFADPRVAAVTGDTFPPDAARSPGGLPPVRLLTNKDPQWFERATFGGLGFGTNMAIRKAACSGWRAFDESLGRGAPLWIGEENHAFARLLSIGCSAAHVPSAIVIHPSKPKDIEQEASTSFAYWLLLFFEFPHHHVDLLRFLLRRLRQKDLSWPRDPQGPGEVINSGWRVYIKAGLKGVLLYLRTRSLRRN